MDEQGVDGSDSAAAACARLLRTGRFDAAVQAAATALARSDQPLAERCELLRLQTLALAETGAHAAAMAAAEALSRESAASADPGLALMAAQALGSCFDRIGDPWQAIHLMARALELHGTAAPPRQRMVALVAMSAFLGDAYHRLGDAAPDADRADLLAQARVRAEAALALLPAVPEPVFEVVAQGNLGEVLLLQGELDMAGRLLQASLDLALAQGFTPYAWRARATRLDWSTRQGRADEAAADAGHLLAEMGGQGPPHTLIRAHAAAARAFRALCRFEAALEHFCHYERLERQRTLAELRAQSQLFVSRAEAERQRRETELARHEAQQLARHASDAALRAERDPLTGLGNRAYLARRAAEIVADGRQGPVALAMLDLDGFKAVNDDHGHAAGDATLQQLAAALRQALRADDVLCRVGGDEFVLLLPRTDADRAREVCERVCAAIRQGRGRCRSRRRAGSRPASGSCRWTRLAGSRPGWRAPTRRSTAPSAAGAIASRPRAAPDQPARAPNSQASSGKLTKASTVLLMMMRATRPLSAP